MSLSSTLNSVTPDTSRGLVSLISLFSDVIAGMPEHVVGSQEQRSIICDTLIFKLTDHGWAGNLPFTYGEAYLALSIPKEFLNN